MKTEDIDKNIGMPDVDAEWAKFEREVINKESARPKRVAAWAAGIGIAASMALMLVLGTHTDTPSGLGPKERFTHEVKQESIKDLTIVSNSSDLGPGHTMRLGATCPKVEDDLELTDSDLQERIVHLELVPNSASLGPDAMRLSSQGQIGGLTDSIVFIPSDSIRQGASASDSILYTVNGRVDLDLNAFQREMGKHVAPDFNFATSAYLFDKNQLFIRWTELQQDSARDESSTKEKAIKLVLDAQTVPFKPTREMTPSEIKTRQTAYLQTAYRARLKREARSDACFSPDLFGSTAEERLFGLLTRQCGSNSVHEDFGPMASDSRGIYVPLVRDVTLRSGDRSWYDEGRLWAVKDDPQCDAVISELRQAAQLAESHVELNDSVVKLAMMSGGRVTVGELHPFNTYMQSALTLSYRKYSSLDQGVFYFTPEADAPSYWWAEAYYSTQARRSVAVHLHAVYKLYAADCPDLLANRRLVEGRVVNEQGEPLADARVSFGVFRNSGLDASARADADGRFSLWMPFRDAPVWVQCWGYKSAKVQPTDSVMTIRLKAVSLKEIKAPKPS